MSNLLEEGFPGRVRRIATAVSVRGRGPVHISYSGHVLIQVGTTSLEVGLPRQVAAEVNARKHGQPAAGVTAPAQPDRLVQMHLFVTRAPNAEDPQAKGPPRNPKKIQLHGDQTAAQRPYTQAELMAWMKHPKTKSDDMKEVLQKPEKSRPNQVGHTFVWNGRPQWKALFEHVKGVHKRKSPEGEAPQVGVFFCGAPAIGKDLTRSSQAYSDQDILFRIMKESF
ncbi:unnamed protein product [Prorocentrum cordatum]|uniref:Ferric reductase NAD binding domain-containing protein n=1 Tax=Prorocentrum cordatum TaxID=2364126 RepID=A0ABN9VWB0_9DINO|nr:unnamed protein product [Polarella glacialis]